MTFVRKLLAAAIVAGTPLAIAPAAQAAQAESVPRRIIIEYKDLSGTQDLSSAPFVSHVRGFHLWQEGKPASLLIQELAENGNPEFILGTAVGDSQHFLDEAVGLPNAPGKGRKIELKVNAAFPLISGGWMLGHTNDGFTGIEGVDAYALTKATSYDVYPLDAGTEKNTEVAADIAALGGLGRIPENGVVARHTGLRGDADVPASFKFDVTRPIGRITLTPVK